jgi:tRNA-binding protein
VCASGVTQSPCFAASCCINTVDPLAAFEALDLRIGRIFRAELNARARKPSYRLWIDFGPLGEKTSSAQLRALYQPDELVGRLVIAAVNLGTRNIAGFLSEVLVLGVPSERGDVVLLAVEREVPLGGRVY